MKNLNHLNIVTPDLGASQEFYNKYFDFEFLFKEGNEIFMTNENGFLLALVETKSQIESPNWLHFGFCANSIDEVKETYEKMKSDGVTFYEELSDLTGNFVRFYAKSPGGHRVEVSWFKLK